MLTIEGADHVFSGAATATMTNAVVGWLRAQPG
jgi:hypothetical protein